MTDLSGRTAVVTGGAAGIGRATAEVLVKRGANVVIGDRSLRAAQEAADRLGDRCVSIEYEAGDEGSIRELVRSAVRTFGGIDILHNNVAITADAWGTDGRLIDTSVEVWDRTMSVNLRSAFVATQEALPSMLEAGRGAIINMGSVAGMRAANSLIAYGTSKAAMIGFTQYVAVQYGAKGIRCNAVSPGSVLTEQVAEAHPKAESAAARVVPMKRIGTVREVAELVAFLAGDAASYINGQNIPVDGGWTSRSP